MTQRWCARWGCLLSLMLLGIAPVVGAEATASGEAPEPAAEPRVYGYNVVDTEVRFAIDWLQRNTGADIVFEGTGTRKVSLHFDDLPLSRALAAIANQLSWYWWRADGVYHLSETPPRVPAPPVRALEPGPMPEGLPSGDAGRFTNLRQSFASRGLTFELIPLKYRDPQEIAWLMGFSPVPPMSVRLQQYRVLDQQGDIQVGLSPSMSSPVTTGIPGVGSGSGFPAAAGGAAQFAPGGGGGLPGAGGAAGAGAGTAVGSGILGSLLPEGAVEEIIAYPPVNAIFVAGTDEGIAVLRELLQLLDVKPVQMILEVAFVSVSESALRGATIGPWSIFWRELSINWAPGIATPGDLTVNWARGNFVSTLTALERESKARVLSRATVIAPNNSVVPFQSFTQTPFFISTTTTGPFGQTVQSTVPVFITSGTNIIIFPKINGDGTITALVNVSVSDVRGFVSSPIAGEIPILDTQTATGVFTVREGETIVMQGFTSSRRSRERSRVPLLGDIPILGPLLFEAKSPTNTDFSEKWIFFTPRILREDEQGLPILAPNQ